MNSSHFININEAGTVLTHKRSSTEAEAICDYAREPVKVAIRHDLSIELHGADFSITKKLTADQALAIISMLGYVLRDHLAVAGYQK